MKKFLLIFCLCLLALGFHRTVRAADVTLEWNPSTGATGYKLYQSADNGVTWDNGTDVGNVTTYTLTGISETGPILFRVSAYNTAGESIRYWSGAWYNFNWQPPANAGGLGIE